MDHEIRPISQAPTAVDANRDSWREPPLSPKVGPDVKIQAVAEEKETGPEGDRIPSPTSHPRDTLISNPHDDPEEGIDWNPGFAHQFPWIGFAGFCTIIIATALAVAILFQSDKKRVKDWPITKFPIQPNVLLNIANQVQNLGLITLIAQGLAIAWWRKALRGSSLGDLHRNHAYSYSFYAILTSGKHFNMIALAALMTKFAVIDSTLFQKATKTRITQQQNYANVTVTGWIEPKWETHSGGIPGDEGRIKTIDAKWASVVEAYSGKIANGKVHDNLDQLSSFINCPFRQECKGTVKGVGFAYSCTSSIENVDYGLQRQTQKGGVSTSYPLWDINFNTSWATDTKPYASIKMNMLYVNSQNGNQSGSCPGTLTRRSCEIRPAVVQYPVVVMVPSEEELKGKNIVTHIKFFDDTMDWPISASLDGVQQIDSLKVMEYQDIIENFNETSTIGAMNYVLSNLYSSSANLTYDNSWDIAARGASAQTTFFADTDKEDNNRCWYNINKPGKDDPTVELLRKINTLSFVAGLYHQNAPKTNQTLRKAQGMTSQQFLASVTGIVEEYQTDRKYVAGALVATFVTVLLVLPVYWGFWQLGRKVTLGPLEITNAFGAPITRPNQTKAYHGDFDQVLEDIKHRRVQYGQLTNAPPGEMGIAEPQRVARPDASHKWRAPGGLRSTRKIGIGAVIGGVIGGLVGANAEG